MHPGLACQLQFSSYQDVRPGLTAEVLVLLLSWPQRLAEARAAEMERTRDERARKEQRRQQREQQRLEAQ